ncbi:unnamed protein product, partial [Urochloa humidicola]
YPLSPVLIPAAATPLAGTASQLAPDRRRRSGARWTGRNTDSGRTTAATAARRSGELQWQLVARCLHLDPWSGDIPVGLLLVRGRAVEPSCCAGHAGPALGQAPRRRDPPHRREVGKRNLDTSALVCSPLAPTEARRPPLAAFGERLMGLDALLQGQAAAMDGEHSGATRSCPFQIVFTPRL